MGPGFRYHVITLSAVFFALAIGLIIGSVFGSPWLSPQILKFSQQQDFAIKELKKSIEVDLEDKRLRIQRYEEGLQELQPLAVRNLLTNSTVGIIATGDYSEAMDKAEEAITSAGGTISARIKITDRLIENDDALERRLMELHATDNRIPLKRTSFLDLLAQLMAYGDSQTKPLFPVFEREGWIRISEASQVGKPSVETVILIGGTRTPDSTRLATTDTLIIRSLQKRNRKVVFCEPESATYSDIAGLRVERLDVCTIDNIETPIGQCALVLAINGEQDDYGIKPTAKRILPPVPERAN